MVISRLYQLPEVKRSNGPNSVARVLAVGHFNQTNNSDGAIPDSRLLSGSVATAMTALPDASAGHHARIERMTQYYLRLLTMAAPARPRARRPSVAGSGTDVTPQPLVRQTAACAAGADSIAIVPTLAAIAANCIFFEMLIS